MGCYLSCLEVKDGKLFDRLRRKFVDHEEIPTLPLVVAKEIYQNKKEGYNAKMQKLRV